MDLIALILYGLVNVVIVFVHLRLKTSIYHFPFWAGVISLGWFFPQAIGGYFNVEAFPDYAVADGLFFATLCSLALWAGYSAAFRRRGSNDTWLDAKFNITRLYWVSAALCLVGFYFQWKLSVLPDEIKMVQQWSGISVRYLFFASVFQFGFISLWLLYLGQPKRWIPRLLIFIVPGLLLLFKVAVLDGRREGMMNFAAYLLIGIWFAKGIAMPRWMMIAGLVFGLVMVNAIGTYRAIMHHGDREFSERIELALSADYASSSAKVLEESGSEFKNYTFYRHVHEETAEYDFGAVHWNLLVFNYVPAQIVGREMKESLMMPLANIKDITRQKYGHAYKRGSTTTGYKDAFGSFGWFGFIKFMLIGWVMGVLYRHAMAGSLLGQLLYIYMLGSGMLAITHTTHRILVSKWIYFLVLAYPGFLWAKERISNIQSIENFDQDERASW